MSVCTFNIKMRNFNVFFFVISEKKITFAYITVVCSASMWYRGAFRLINNTI